MLDQGDYIKGKPENVSKELQDLLSHMLDINIGSRFCIEEIKEHEWIMNKGKYKKIKLNNLENPPEKKKKEYLTLEPEF